VDYLEVVYMHAMIARTWHGVVHANDAQSYVDYLRQTGFANLKSTPGNQEPLPVWLR